MTLTNTYTDTATPSCTASPTPTSTGTPTFTETYTYSATPTITPTLPPFPYLLVIGVYNEAGELVTTIARSPVSAAMSGAAFSVGLNHDPDTMVPGDPLAIYMPGLVTPDNMGQPGTYFYWNGTTDASQPVASGNYYIKITQRDTFDHVTVYIRSFAVLRAEEYVELSIYNSAGELVRTVRKNAMPPDRVDLTTNDVLVVEKTGNDIVINYGPNLQDYLSWDGKNNHGAAVTSGTYELQVTTKTMSGTMAIISKTVMILSEGSKYVGDIKAYPNPYYSDGNMTFAWSGLGSGEMLVNIHNMNGELIRSLSGRVEAGSLTWDGKTTGGNKTGHGYYICIFKAKNLDGYVEHKKLKIAIMGF